ncbi:hypothetical protein HAX54_011858 [Datura stramonium]|uniref:Uncharacterized protein n=1 Tax=Datura stramonium TaxID=4076 RepID=A0ABS8TIT0_DATST|nr:hypothetical protein [Datura stramonium]
MASVKLVDVLYEIGPNPVFNKPISKRWKWVENLSLILGILLKILSFVTPREILTGDRWLLSLEGKLEESGNKEEVKDFGKTNRKEQLESC